jgi:hypothetical protein
MHAAGKFDAQISASGRRVLRRKNAPGENVLIQREGARRKPSS